MDDEITPEQLSELTGVSYVDSKDLMSKPEPVPGVHRWVVRVVVDCDEEGLNDMYSEITKDADDGRDSHVGTLALDLGKMIMVSTPGCIHCHHEWSPEEYIGSCPGTHSHPHIHE